MKIREQNADVMSGNLVGTPRQEPKSNKTPLHSPRLWVLLVVLVGLDIWQPRGILVDIPLLLIFYFWYRRDVP